MKRVDDPRRQLIVLTGDDADITAFESAAVTAALDRAGGAMRVVAIGATAGSNLVRTAVRSGGAAIGVDPDPAAAVRAIDVLTSTFADQYRVVATMAAAGSQVVRLTVEGRRYETVVPGLGPPSAPPSSSDSDLVGPADHGWPARDARSARGCARRGADDSQPPTTVPTVAAVPAVGIHRSALPTTDAMARRAHPRPWPRRRRSSPSPASPHHRGGDAQAPIATGPRRRRSLLAEEVDQRPLAAHAPAPTPDARLAAELGQHSVEVRAPPHRCPLGRRRRGSRPASPRDHRWS